MKPFLYQFLFTAILFLATGCHAFMEGYTRANASDTYLLITGAQNNFGDQRLHYIKGSRKHSCLSQFIDCKQNPDFIFEYVSKSKCQGIELFYVNIDSVYVFEEPSKSNLNSQLKEKRKITVEEKSIYQNLQQLAKK